MSDEAEHSLTKADVVLTFAVEVCTDGGYIYVFYVFPLFQLILPQTYIMYPDAVRPIYLSDREDSQAYHLKWRKLQLMHLCRSVDVNT